MITLHQKEFLNGIKAVKTAVSKMDLQPILKTIYIKSIGQGLELTGTDLNNSARTVIEANVTEPIDICVNADKLEGIVSRLDDLITIDKKDAIIHIKSGKTIFKLLYLEASEFPTIEFNLTDDKVVLGHDEFVSGIAKTCFCTNNIDNQILSGVCITFDNDNYEMAATDGNRLSQVIFGTPINRECRYVIPKKVLIDVSRFIGKEVEIYFNKNRVIFKTDNYLFSSNILEGQYPKYNQLIPTTSPVVVTLNKNEFLHSLDKVAFLSDEKTNLIVFDFKNNTLFLTSKCEGETANDELDIDFNGELKICFNYKYLIEGIKAMSTDEITFNMNTSLSPCVIKGDYTYLVMPVQMRD